MVLKGAIQAGHAPVNNYKMVIVGLPDILFVTISGFEIETEAIDLPDRTSVSGGNSKPVEFTGTTFEHHIAEKAALELWRLEGLDPVSPLYKKAGTLIRLNISGNTIGTQVLTGLWISKKKNADLDLANEGDPSMIEWTFKTDSVLGT